MYIYEWQNRFNSIITTSSEIDHKVMFADILNIVLYYDSDIIKWNQLLISRFSFLIKYDGISNGQWFIMSNDQLNIVEWS